MTINTMPSKAQQSRKCKKRLVCSCCGTDYTGRQWPNQDSGLGICSSCATWLTEEKDYSKAHVERLYGWFGVNHSLEKENKDV